MKFKLRDSLLAGFGFGTTSGVITTLGVITGIYASSGSKMGVLTAIITVSIADAFSDALGEHISEEYKRHTTEQDVRNITFSTFLSKLLVGISFTIPFLFFPINHAVIISILYGAVVLSALSVRVAKNSSRSNLGVIAEHIAVASLVVFITFFVGKIVESLLAKFGI